MRYISFNSAKHDLVLELIGAMLGSFSGEMKKGLCGINKLYFLYVSVYENTSL